MAIAINTNIVADLEKELNAYAKALVDGTSVSVLAEAFGKIMKTERTRNVPTIIKEFIAIAKDDLILQGADKRMATRIAKEVITKQTELILARIN
jgi:hypothetical protein